jgi:hypothetical protein
MAQFIAPEFTEKTKSAASGGISFSMLEDDEKDPYAWFGKAAGGEAEIAKSGKESAQSISPISQNTRTWFAKLSEAYTKADWGTIGELIHFDRVSPLQVANPYFHLSELYKVWSGTIPSFVKDSQSDKNIATEFVNQSSTKTYRIYISEGDSEKLFTKNQMKIMRQQ